MTLVFVLSMPGCASWNGRWSGEGKLYSIVRRFRGKSPEPGHYSYAWPDGWRASVEVRQVDFSEARRLRRNSKGFCGYDWMVDSIVKHGRIQCEER